MSRLTIQTACQVTQLTIQGLHGVKVNKIAAASNDGSYVISVPREAYAGLAVLPGEAILASITLTRIAIEDGELPELLNADEFAQFRKIEQ